VAFRAAFFCLRGSRALFFFVSLASFGFAVFGGAAVVTPTAAAILPAAVPIVLAAVTKVLSDDSGASCSFVMLAILSSKRPHTAKLRGIHDYEGALRAMASARIARSFP
jgi:hypothetical protein